MQLEAWTGLAAQAGFRIAYKHWGTLGWGGLVQGSDSVRLLDPCLLCGH